MTDDKNVPDGSSSKNEGEGSRTGAREYNERTRRFINSGQVDERARDAEKALDGPERDELEEAEDEGRSHSHGEDPGLNRRSGS